MATIYEQGHTINVANFEKMILTLEAFSDSYQPSNEEITIVQLRAVYEQSKDAVQEVTTAYTNYTYAVNERQLLFAGIKKLATKIVNAIIASGANYKTIEDVKNINQKIQGTSTSRRAALFIDETQQDTTNDTSMRLISNSQQSYNQLTERFSRLVSLVLAEPKYQPKEQQTSRNGLVTYLQDLQEANTSVNTQYIALQGARNKRNAVLYAPQTGMYDLTMKIKSYIKSVYAQKDPEYKQIFAIRFKRK